MSHDFICNESGQPATVQVSTLSQEIVAFLTDRQARGLSKRTVEFYRQELAGLRAYLEAQDIDDVLSLTADHLHAYLAQLARRRNAGGVHASYRAVKTFLRWFQVESDPLGGWANPIARVRAPRLAVRRGDPLPVKDFLAMLATCDRSFAGDRDRAIQLALLDTGCRAAEFLALDVGDVDLDRGTTIVRGAGRSRIVFLGSQARRWLRAYLAHRPNASPGAPLWVTQQDARLTYAGLRRIIGQRARRAGVPVPSLRSFRRAFALLSLRGGMSVLCLQRLMGYSSLSGLRCHWIQSQEDLRRGHEQAGPVDSICSGQMGESDNDDSSSGNDDATEPPAVPVPEAPCP